jgi:hypothetical protein
MAKMTGIYKITLPDVPISEMEMPNQRPIVIKTDAEKIKVFPPGYNCEKLCKRIQGKNSRLTVGTSQLGVQNADAISIMIEKDACVSDEKDARIEHERLDAKVEYFAFKIMRLLRKHLSQTPIAIPNRLHYQALYRCDSPELKNYLWSSASGTPVVIYTSSKYYLDREKWSAVRKSIRQDTDTEIWEDFIYDAKAALKSRDFTKAIIYAAVACEVFIKDYTEKKVRENHFSQAAWKRLKERQPRVLEYYDSILHLITDHSLNVEQEDLYKSMRKLFKMRNNIMHEGKYALEQDISKEIKDIIKKAETTINWILNL